MIIEVSGGKAGIQQYLESGVKKDREFNRESADKRLILSGDLDVTDSVIKSSNFSENYLHISLSFKEDFVEEKFLQKASDEFEQFVKASYSDDELCYYSEAHIPKLKSYTSKNAEVVIRKPHIHIVINNKNLLTGNYINPLGYIKNNINYIDAFQEQFNQNFGFESPKDNLRHEFNIESSIVSRQKGDLFIRNKSEKEDFLNHILENKISSYEKFQDYLKTHGNIKYRNKAKENQYLNIKLPHQKQGINLKEFCFSKEFIEEYDFNDKLDFLQKKTEETFIEQKESYSNKLTEKYESDLNDWFTYKAKEIKYINQNTKFYKEVYRHLSSEEKIEILNQKEKEFYEKYDLINEIEHEIIDLKKEDLEDLNLNLSNSHVANSKTSVVSQKIEDIEEEKILNNIDFFTLNTSHLYKELKVNKGVLNEKIKLKNNQLFLNNDEKTVVNNKEFLLKQMNLLGGEIQELQNTISQKIEHNYNKNEGIMDLTTKNNEIKVNIKTRDNSNEVDYLQLGTVNRIGKFTGFIYDQADIERKSSATLFVIEDKVVDYEDFQQLDSLLELDSKLTLLADQSKETYYSKQLKMNCVRENLTLTQSGQSYANSKHNFKELRPIEAGISKFDNMKSLDKNIFTKTKEWFLENYYAAKDNIQYALTSKRDLAASNVELLTELKQMRIEVESLKNYQQAFDEKQKVLDNTKEQSQGQNNQEEQTQENKEYEFKDVLLKAKDMGETIKDAKEIDGVEISDTFKEQRDVAIKLLDNAKSEKNQIPMKDIEKFNLSQSKIFNYISSQNMQIPDIYVVERLTTMAESLKSVCEANGLEFQNLIASKIQEFAEKNNLVENTQTKEQNKGIER